MESWRRATGEHIIRKQAAWSRNCSSSSPSGRDRVCNGHDLIQAQPVHYFINVLEIEITDSACSSPSGSTSRARSPRRDSYPPTYRQHSVSSAPETSFTGRMDNMLSRDCEPLSVAAPVTAPVAEPVVRRNNYYRRKES